MKFKMQNAVKKIFIYLVLLIAVVVGCTSEEAATKIQTPENLLQPEILKKVMLDIQLAESYVQTIKADSSANQVPIEEYYQQIFAIHGTDYQQFKESFEYYLHLPDSLQNMYEDMLNTLSKMEAPLRSDKRGR